MTMPTPQCWQCFSPPEEPDCLTNQTFRYQRASPGTTATTNGAVTATVGRPERAGSSPLVVTPGSWPLCHRATGAVLHIRSGRQWRMQGPSSVRPVRSPELSAAGPPVTDAASPDAGARPPPARPTWTASASDRRAAHPDRCRDSGPQLRPGLQPDRRRAPRRHQQSRAGRRCGDAADPGRGRIRSARCGDRLPGGPADRRIDGARRTQCVAGPGGNGPDRRTAAGRRSGHPAGRRVSARRAARTGAHSGGTAMACGARTAGPGDAGGVRHAASPVDQRPARRGGAAAAAEHRQSRDAGLSIRGRRGSTRSSGRSSRRCRRGRSGTSPRRTAGPTPVT